MRWTKWKYKPDYDITCNGLRNWFFLIISFHLLIFLIPFLSSCACACVCLCRFCISICWKIVFSFSFRWCKLKWMFLMLFAIYHFIGLVLLLILRASAIVLADIGPQFLPLGVHRYTHCIICIQNPFVSLCFISFKVADWNSIGAGITLKCSKNVWNLFEKYFSQRLTSASCSHGNSLFWSNDSRSKCHTYCIFN